MDVLDRIAAWTGAVVSLIGLAWRLITWRRSRHKIKVSVTNILYPKPGFAPLHFVKIKAVNTGPDQVTITNWGIKAKGSGEIGPFSRFPLTNSVPTSLGINEYVEFYVDSEALRGVNNEFKIPFKHMIPWVALSNDKKVHSKRAVPLA